MKKTTVDTAVLPDSASAPDAAPTATISRWKDYLTLTKPEITFLVTLSAVAGFMLGSGPELDLWLMLLSVVGISMTSAGACALNHYHERMIDGEMRRTANRPLPSGRLKARSVRWFGILHICVGIGLLCPLVNPLTALLAIITVVVYLYLYTPLKQKTKYNTLIGTIPGALPALGGWTAATNAIGWGGIAIFAILVLWQIPHFFSLAWMYRKDYGRAGYAMLPVLEPDGRSTAFQTLAFTILLVLVSFTPTLLGDTGLLYAFGALVLGVFFLRPAIVFYRTLSVADARRVLKTSVIYIPLLVLMILVDRLLPGLPLVP